MKTKIRTLTLALALAGALTGLASCGGSAPTASTSTEPVKREYCNPGAKRCFWCDPNHVTKTVSEELHYHDQRYAAMEGRAPQVSGSTITEAWSCNTPKERS